EEIVVPTAQYLAPLLKAVHEQEELLVVHTDSHRGRVYGAGCGRADLVHEIDEAVRQRQQSAGERWGIGQATIARHREDIILHYRKELVAAIEKIWAAHTFHGLMLLGEHEILEHLRKQLPPRLSAQVVHEGPCAWAKPLGMAEVTELVAAATKGQERKIMSELADRLERNYGPGSNQPGF